jgi:hypothetical protein
LSTAAIGAPGVLFGWRRLSKAQMLVEAMLAHEELGLGAILLFNHW